MCCDILFILLYKRVTWSWHVYDCSVYVLFINRVLQSGIRAISIVGRSLDRTGWVLGLLLSNPCLLKLFYYYTPWILWLLPVLPWFLSLKNSFRRFWPESVIWPPWVLARWPFYNRENSIHATTTLWNWVSRWKSCHSMAWISTWDPISTSCSGMNPTNPL